MKRFVTAIGIVLALAALAIGLTNLHATDHGSEVSCGNAFDDTAHGDALSTDIKNRAYYRASGYPEPTNFTDRCQDKQSMFKIFAIGVGVAGVALLVGAIFIPARREGTA